MDREEAIDIIKKMYKGEPTRKQLEALDIAYHDMELRIKKEVKGKFYISDGKQHFNCPHCNCLIHPTNSERICRFCGGELSWKEEIKKGNVIAG